MKDWNQQGCFSGRINGPPFNQEQMFSPTAQNYFTKLMLKEITKAKISAESKYTNISQAYEILL